MKKILILLALAAGTLPALAAESVKATVNGMVCAFCAQGIEKKLKAMPATEAVYVNLADKVVAVQAKDGQTLDVDKIRAEVKDAGYDVVKVETVADTVDAMRSAAKAGKQ